MMDITTIRPKLKQDSIFLPTADGVLFRNGDKIFSLKGKKIYQWVTSVVPHLTGALTLAEMCAPLAPEQGAMLSKIVLALLEKGIVKNHVPEAAETLSEAVRTRFKAQIDLIDHYAERPLAKFKAFRRGQIILTGAGESLGALACALLRNGLEQIVLALPAGTQIELQAIEAEVAALRGAGLKAGCSVLDSAVLDRPKQTDKPELVVYCADVPNLRAAHALQAQCARTGREFIAGLAFDGRSLIGPFVKPGQPCCLLCGFLRLSANLEERQQARLWRSLVLDTDLAAGDASRLSGPTAKMLGNNLAFEIFKLRSEFLPAEADGGVLLQDLHTLESTRAALLPHPLCPVCSSADPATERAQLAEITQGAYDQELNREAFQLRWYPHINETFGLCKKFEGDDLIQLPLRTTLLLAGDPAEAAAPRRIYAYSEESTAQARYNALLEAASFYAQTVVDVRRMTRNSYRELHEAGLAPVAPQQLATWTGGPCFDEQTQVAWLPAFSLAEQRLAHVPAAAVYPASALNNGAWFEQAGAGAAAAQTFGEVANKGLLAALSYERLRALEQGDASLVALDAEQLGAADDELAFLVTSAGRLDASLRLFEVAGAAPVRVVIAATVEADARAARLVKTGHGLALGEAAKQALLALVAELQIPEAQTAPDEVLLNALAAADAAPRLAAELYQAPPARIEDVYDFLQRQGRAAFFVNTTTKDLQQTQTLITGRVLLTVQSK
jgi:bacteriocin biosynthesis cyclodehydratase domain-containing protein